MSAQCDGELFDVIVCLCCMGSASGYGLLPGLDRLGKVIVCEGNCAGERFMLFHPNCFEFGLLVGLVCRDVLVVL